MLIRTKPRKRSRKIVSRIGDLFLAGLGIYGLYLATHGIFSGRIEVFSRYGSGVFYAANAAVSFWVTVALWLAGGVFLLFLAFSRWRE